MSKTVVEIRGEEHGDDGDGSKDLAERGFQEVGVKYFYLKKATEKEIFLKSLLEWSGNPADLIAILLRTESEEAARFLKEFRNFGKEIRKKLIIFWTDGSYTRKDFDIFKQYAYKTAQKVDFYDFCTIKNNGIGLIQKILNELEKMSES